MCALALLLPSLAHGEEAYLTTSNMLSTCYGLEMRSLMAPGHKIISSVELDDLLQKKCGFLEQRVRDQFIGYLRDQIQRPMNEKEQAEFFMTLVAQLELQFTVGGVRRAFVDAYRCSTTKAAACNDPPKAAH
jgi:hypothetical protein